MKCPVFASRLVHWPVWGFFVCVRPVTEPARPQWLLRVGLGADEHRPPSNPVEARPAAVRHLGGRRRTRPPRGRLGPRGASRTQTAGRDTQPPAARSVPQRGAVAAVHLGQPEEVLQLDRGDGRTWEHVDGAVAPAHLKPQEHALLAHGQREDDLRTPRVPSPEDWAQQRRLQLELEGAGHPDVIGRAKREPLGQAVLPPALVIEEQEGRVEILGEIDEVGGGSSEHGPTVETG